MFTQVNGSQSLLVAVTHLDSNCVETSAQACLLELWA